MGTKSKKMEKAMNRLLPVIYIGAVAAAIALSGCGPRGNSPNVELIQDMMEQPAVKAQKADDTWGDGMSTRVPPEHTQPIGFKPYRWPTDIDAAVRENKNPMAGDFSDEILLTGQNYYNTNCMVCHGVKADGNGPIKAKYPLPIPSLQSDKIKGWPDAHVYHVITMGQGTMGPYASMVPEKVRWQLVNYIRHLQKQ